MAGAPGRRRSTTFTMCFRVLRLRSSLSDFSLPDRPRACLRQALGRTYALRHGKFQVTRRTSHGTGRQLGMRFPGSGLALNTDRDPGLGLGVPTPGESFDRELIITGTE